MAVRRIGHTIDILFKQESLCPIAIFYGTLALQFLEVWERVSLFGIFTVIYSWRTSEMSKPFTDCNTW